MREFNTLSLIILIVWFPANLVINWYTLYEHGTLETIKFVNNMSNFLYPLIVGAVTYVAHCSRTNVECSALTALDRGFRYYWPICKANIVAGIKIVVGLILLIVPGLYFATRYSLINPVVIAEGEEHGLPRNRSLELTKGVSWTIFWVGLLLFGGNMTLSMTAGMFDKPVHGTYQFILYSLRDTFFDLTGCLATIAMYLFYCHIKTSKVIDESGKEVDVTDLVIAAK